MTSRIRNLGMKTRRTRYHTALGACIRSVSDFWVIFPDGPKRQRFFWIGTKPVGGFSFHTQNSKGTLARAEPLILLPRQGQLPFCRCNTHKGGAAPAPVVHSAARTLVHLALYLEAEVAVDPPEGMLVAGTAVLTARAFGRSLEEQSERTSRSRTRPSTLLVQPPPRMVGHRTSGIGHWETVSFGTPDIGARMFI